MFSQLESTLNIKLKREFVLNKLFPNDIISDIIVVEKEDIKSDIDSTDDRKDEIMSMFEEDDIKSESVKLFSVIKKGNVDIVKLNLNLNINW
jgi:hypothetical protein